MADVTQLQDLQPDSGKRLPVSVVEHFTRYAEMLLPVSLTIMNGRPVAKRSSAPHAPMFRSEQRLKKLGAEPGDYQALQLNDALLGGSDYPVLGAVLGAASGIGTGGAGLLFTVATTSLSVAKTARRVLARDGDEIWRVEEIGKVKGNPTFLVAYFLVDPHRGHSQSHKGWLLHEDRYDLID